MALPSLPSLGQNPWYVPRTNWDNAVDAALADVPNAIAAQATDVDARRYASPQAAVTAAPSGSSVWFDPRTTWNLTTAITINKPLTIRGNQTLMTQSGVGQPMFTVTSSDVHFDGLDLQGRQSATISLNERAINFVGNSAGDRLLRTSVRNTRIRRWGYAGVIAKFVSRFTWENLVVEDISYAGLGVVSGESGKVLNSTIDTIVQGVGATNSYGVFASHDETVNQAISPRSANIEFNNVRVSNVPLWEGMDTHAGINISFINCQTYNCKYAIAAVPGRAGGVPYVLAPKGILIQGCVLDSGRTDGVVTVGIQLTGCSTAVGFHNNTDFATGIVMGNTVKYFGNEAASTGCALNLQDTRGAIVMGNTFLEPAASAIRLDYNNQDATVSGNSATDAWSNTVAIAAMINTTSTYNTFKAVGNTLVRGAKTATTINAQGLRLGSALATLCLEGNNDFSAATTPYTGANGLIRHDRRGIQDGFVTALPALGVWQRSSQALSTVPTASASPGWVCVTAGGASSATWAATTAYTAAAWVKDSTGKVYECLIAGTSGATEPVPGAIGSLVVDGTITWAYRAATSAVFKTLPALGA